MENINKTGLEIARTALPINWAQIELLKRPQGDYIRKSMSGGAQRLEWQYEWLKKRENLPHFPRPEFPCKGPGKFSYEMKFDQNFVPFFQVIQSDEKLAKVVLEKIWFFIETEVHIQKTSRYAPELFNKYIYEKLIKKIQTCEELIPGLSSMLKYEYIEINGMKYKNFGTIVSVLLESKTIRDFISHYSECPVHGDLTIENILLDSTGEFLLLDPNGENILSCPAVDLAKLCQSLRSGYEYMLNCDQILVKNGAIFYRLHSSDTYRELFRFLSSGPARDHFKKEGPGLLFHEAMHFARLLPYRALKAASHLVRPDSFFLFYANMIKLFNEFLTEMGHHEKVPSGHSLF